MSVSNQSYTSVYGPMVGRGELETNVLRTIGAWIIAYVAEIERQRGLPARSVVIPPTPESIHGGVDFLTFGSELMPEIIVVTQPTGEVERFDPGTYGQWFSLEIGAIVQVEGDQDKTRQLAGIYGTALQGLVAQQGAFGYLDQTGRWSVVPSPETTPFATRTRLYTSAGAEFPDEAVRDIISTRLQAHTFVATLADDFVGPRVPPADPYATPAPWPNANEVWIDIVRNPDTVGITTADAVVEDATVNPPVVRYQTTQADNVAPPQ